LVQICLLHENTKLINIFIRIDPDIRTIVRVTFGRADVQDSADVISAVSEPAHLAAHQRTQHSIVVRPTAVRAISTDIIFQTIVQHCRTSYLELTATCLIKLRLSLYFQIQTFLLLSANYSTTRVCGLLTALWRYINFVLLLLLLLLLLVILQYSWRCFFANLWWCMSFLNSLGLSTIKRQHYNS